MQRFAHSLLNNAGLFFLMRFHHKQANVAEGKSPFSHHKPPSFIPATSAPLGRRQQVTGSQAKHAVLNFAPSLSRERGNLRSRFRISASISLSLPLLNSRAPTGNSDALSAERCARFLSPPPAQQHAPRRPGSQGFLEYISPPFN